MLIDLDPFLPIWVEFYRASFQLDGRCGSRLVPKMLCASFELTPSPFNDSYEASVAYLRWESLCILSRDAGRGWGSEDLVCEAKSMYYVL